MKIKDDILFRLEYFGGIIINKINFKRVELTFDESLFIFTSQYVDEKSSEEIVLKVLNKECLDLKKLSSLNIFEENNNQISFDYNYNDIFNKVKQAYIDIKKTDILTFPLEIIIYPSMKCNLNCKFCFVQEKNDKKVYGAEYWEKVLVEAKEQGALSISILGGEPSLYYDIDNLLRICDRLQINTVITTNGLCLKESTKKIIISSKKIIPSVSIQSLDNLNWLLMGCDYKRQLEFVEECLNNNKTVRINSVFTYQTFEQIRDIYNYCNKNGIKRYSISNYSNIKENKEMQYAHNLTELAQLDYNIKNYVKENINDNEIITRFSAEGCMLFSCYPNKVAEKLEFSEFEKQYFSCRGKYTKMEIFSDGSVYPCCRFETVVESTSNIFSDNSLKQIWHKDENFNLIRKQNIDNRICSGCIYLNICNGGCYPSRLKLNEDISVLRDPNCQIKIGEYE